MIVCDTSGLYAAYIANQARHSEVRAAVDTQPGPLVVSSFVLTELDYLLRTKAGIDAEAGRLRDIAAGAYEVAGLSNSEVGQAISLIERYSNRNLGLADAANVVLAARYRTTTLLTLDERDDRIVRPMWGDNFRILPAEA